MKRRRKNKISPGFRTIHGKGPLIGPQGEKIIYLSIKFFCSVLEMIIS